MTPYYYYLYYYYSYYNPEPEQETRGGGSRRGRGARDGVTGRRGRVRPPLQAQLPRGQQTIMAYLRK